MDFNLYMNSTSGFDIVQYTMKVSINLLRN